MAVLVQLFFKHRDVIVVTYVHCNRNEIRTGRENGLSHWQNLYSELEKLLLLIEEISEESLK